MDDDQRVFVRNRLFNLELKKAARNMDRAVDVTCIPFIAFADVNQYVFVSAFSEIQIVMNRNGWYFGFGLSDELLGCEGHSEGIVHLVGGRE